MDRIFLAIIVSGLLLAATSTALLVFSSSGHPMMTVTAVNLPASADMHDSWSMSRRTGSDKLAPFDSARREQTRF
jgi:hypothetical protein